MAALPALVENKPQYCFWDKITSAQQNYWIETARMYQKKQLNHTPRAVVFIPSIAVLPHDLAPPVKHIEKILCYEDFNINNLLITGVTVQYKLGLETIFLRQIPYISENTFPILWAQTKRKKTEWRMVMAALRIGEIFFITVDLATQYLDYQKKPYTVVLYGILENIHNAWVAAKDNAKNTISSLELFREYIVNGIAATTTDIVSDSLFDRVTRHNTWAKMFFNPQRDPDMHDIERHFQKIRLSLTGRRLNRKFLDEYETIVDFPHAYYAVTKPIRVDYSENTNSRRPPHRTNLKEWVRPRMPMTRYLLILPKIGFEPATRSGSVTILSERQVGHPHLYRSGNACYGEISTLFGDAYSSGNYTTMLIRAAHMLRLWNPRSLAGSTHDFTNNRNLIVCEEKCCDCARVCDNRCRFCLYTTPDEFMRCELEAKDQIISKEEGYGFHGRNELRDINSFTCDAWKGQTLSLCCAESQCPFYTGYWKPIHPPTYPCINERPCAHCPEENCALRKNPFIYSTESRKVYTNRLRKIRNRLRARFKLLDADEMPEPRSYS